MHISFNKEKAGQYGPSVPVWSFQTEIDDDMLGQKYGIWLAKSLRYLSPYITCVGAISTEHSSTELRVIGTNDHRVDSYFLHLTMPN